MHGSIEGPSRLAAWRSAYQLDFINGDLNAHAPLLKFRNVVPKHIFPGITSVMGINQVGHFDFVFDSNQLIFKNNQPEGLVFCYIELLDRRDRAQLKLELISVNLFECGGRGLSCPIANS